MLEGATDDLNTCWAFQITFYFEMHQHGMLGLSPSRPLWTHYSRAPVQGWDATALIYYSEVIHRLWIQGQLNYAVGTAEAAPENFTMYDLPELRWESKQTEGDVGSVQMAVRQAFSDKLLLQMKECLQLPPPIFRNINTNVRNVWASSVWWD